MLIVNVGRFFQTIQATHLTVSTCFPYQKDCNLTFLSGRDSERLSHQGESGGLASVNRAERGYTIGSHLQAVHDTKMGH